MNNQKKHQAARAFAEAFAESLVEILKQKNLKSWEIKITDDPSIKNSDEKVFHTRLSANGSLRGECFVALPQSQLSSILGQTESEFTDDHGEAFSDLITATIEGLCSPLHPQYGSLVFKVGRVEDLVLEGMFFIPMVASEEGKPAIEMRLYFDVSLLGALASSQGNASLENEQQASIDPTNLKLVMDVELNVSLRFGQCQLPLREVLDLASGSVIELDRDVDDPVELLLDGKIIARGEAVIIDGNYGLRVTEIPQPMASHFIR